MSISGPILTKAALLGKKPVDDFKVFVHETKKRTGAKQQSKFSSKKSDDDPKNPKDETHFNLLNARKEVINLGISGLSDKHEKEEAEIALAIKLGAKAPKKQYKNYKELLNEKKQKVNPNETTTTKISKKYQFGATQSFNKYVANARSKTKKNPKNVLQSYGKVQKKDLLNNKRRRK